MATLEYFQYPYMDDNYGVLVHAPATGETVSIDCGNANATNKALKQNNWSLSHIWVTHHHADHIAGLKALKQQHTCFVIGPDSIDDVDQIVTDNNSFEFASTPVTALHTPGHTLDMINYHLPTEKTVFTGDTLFSLGCGRIFEGNADMMWNSLVKLMQLPSDTTVYSSHEYTKANAAFALSVDPTNQALVKRAALVDKLRDNDEPTVPSLLSEELATNPFLRASDKDIRQLLHLPDATDSEVFAEIRKRKDNF